MEEMIVANMISYNRERGNRLSRWPLTVTKTEEKKAENELVIPYLYRDEVVKLTIHLSQKKIVYVVSKTQRYEVRIDFEQMRKENKTDAFLEILIYLVALLCGSKVAYEREEETKIFFDDNKHRIKRITYLDTEYARLELILQLISFLKEALQKDLD